MACIIFYIWENIIKEHKGGKKMRSRCLDYIALTFVIIGAVNWGLIGFFKFDLVAFLFGNMTWLSRLIYDIVGICGLYMISLFGRITSFGENR